MNENSNPHSAGSIHLKKKIPFWKTVMVLSLLIVNFCLLFLIKGGCNPRYKRELERRAFWVSHAIIKATLAFKDDRHMLPLPSDASRVTDTDATTLASGGFLSVLGGGSRSPQGKVYLVPFRELVIQECGYSCYDPWGNPYYVRLDSDGDGFVVDPEHPGKKLLQSIVIWSGGGDGDPDTWSDNIASWFSFKDYDFSRE